MPDIVERAEAVLGGQFSGQHIGFADAAYPLLVELVAELKTTRAELETVRSQIETERAENERLRGMSWANTRYLADD